MRRSWLALVVGGMLFSAVAPVFAHHSFDAEFDRTKKVTVEGVLKKIEWMNPHIWFYVEGKDSNGKMATWGFSSLPPGVLLRKGVTKDTLKIGEKVKVEGFGARDGSNNADADNIYFSDGRKFTGFSLAFGQ